jgi:NADH-quinone oxidoreductase subunit A
MFFFFGKFVFINFLFSLFLSMLIISLSYLIVPQRNDIDKVTSYECGFDPFNDAREPFDVKFYLVSILFIIFDLEVLFLFPWVVSYVYLPSFCFFFLLFFLFVIGIGFFYEWRNKAMDWS